MWSENSFQKQYELNLVSKTATEQLRCLERATGIEPAFSAWEADVLPLNYARNVEIPPTSLNQASEASTSKG